MSTGWRRRASRALAGPTPTIRTRLLLIVGGFAAPLLLLEAALRLFGAFLPGNYDTGAFLVRHPVYGHYHPANYHGWVKRDEFTVEVNTNDFGQRGPEITPERVADRPRILILGDSFVEAVQVSERRRLVGRLNGLLSGGRSQDSVDVVDGGCGGWGTAQELLYLQHDGKKFQPDLVLLAFYVGNDVSNNSVDLELDGQLNVALKPYFELGSDGQLKLLEPRPPPPGPWEVVALRLRTYSAVYNMFESGVLQKLSLDNTWAAWRDLDALVELRRRGLEVFLANPDDRWQHAWAITEALIKTTRDEASSIGSKFAIVIIPTKQQVSNVAWMEMGGPDGGVGQGLDYQYPNRRLSQLSARLGVPTLDLLPSLRAPRGSSAPPLYYERDEHWTSEGHRLAAQAIADFIKRDALLPR